MAQDLKMPVFTEYHNKDALMGALATTVSSQLENVLKVKDRVTLAVPGGSTPKLFFHKLSKIQLDWNRVLVIPTDERFVPETSDLSNAGFIRSTLLQNCAIEAKILTFFKPSVPIEELVRHISNELQTILPIDVCILGMGLDMHTASIFPDSDRSRIS